MDEKCRKLWRLGMACPPGQPLPLLAEPADGKPTSNSLGNDANRPGIAFGVEPRSQVPLERSAPIPGYNAPALPLKPVRDPSLSLIALDGIDPSGPVMVEVPLVQNNTTFTANPSSTGRRVGFADWFVQGKRREQIEHRASFLRALDILRRVNTQLVPVPALSPDETRRTRNEIDDLMREYRLDALVCDSQCKAFHGACWSGYPGVSELLADGTTLWFYGARWAGDRVRGLAQVYRRALTQPGDC